MLADFMYETTNLHHNDTLGDAHKDNQITRNTESFISRPIRRVKCVERMTSSEYAKSISFGKCFCWPEITQLIKVSSTSRDLQLKIGK